MNNIDNREFVSRRGELMAELFLQDLNPFYIARNNISDNIGIDFFVGFLNPRGGLNLIAVEVKATEKSSLKQYQLSNRTYQLLANSNIPSVLLVVNVKENRYFFHVPSKIEYESGRNFVTVALVDVTNEPRDILLKKIFLGNAEFQEMPENKSQ